MTYLIQAEIADNVAMRNRVAQAAAQEGVAGDPDTWTYDHRRTWASAPGWDAAWESYKVSNTGADPGVNPGVITDSMILSQVQVMNPDQESDL